jgi:glycosyltransferase involved in cell wall biosynthesis
MKPKVTIGVCVRNNAATIRDTIKSIIAQDYPHELMEVIIVDGCSQDKTVFIAENVLNKSNIKTRIFTENEGLGFARQIVVNNAEGDYILWVDGDMVLSKDYLRKLLDFMNKNPDVGIVKGKQALQPGKNLLATLEAYSRVAGRMVNYQSRKGHFKALGTAGALCRTDALKDAGGFDISLRGYNEDWDMEIRVRSKGWLLCTIDAFYLDYERGELTSNVLWRKYWLRGYYTHYFLHKNKGMLRHCRNIPITAFFAGLLHAFTIYKKTRQSKVFWLPFQYVFKMTAWYLGFIKSHMNSYAPVSPNLKMVAKKVGG